MSNVCQYFAPKTTKKLSTIDPKDNVFDINRKQLLHDLFVKIDGQINTIKSHLFSPLMQSLFKFVSENCFTNNMRDKRFETKFNDNYGLIATVLLSIGMNSSEHKFICDLLIETIQDLTSFVVYLNSSQNQTIVSILNAIRDSILNEEVIESANLDQNQIKRLTFGSLFEIYEEYVINKNVNNFCPPIVLFLDKIECFEHSLVSTLIEIIKEYMKTIPFIVIMIKSNETISLQNLLPSSATDLLIVHHFQSISGHVVIDRIISELLIESSLPLKLGPNVLEFIIKMFEKFDFSIASIEFIIKYAIFRHFFANDLSFLCQTKSTLKTYLKNIDSNELIVLRKSQLFSTSSNNKELKTIITTKITEFVSIHTQFVYNLNILLKLSQKYNKDINLLDFYVNALNESFDFKQNMNLLNKLSQNQWMFALEECLTDVSLNGETQPLINVLKCRQKELIALINQLKIEPKVVMEKIDISVLKDKMAKLKTRHQWKEIINPLNKPKVLSKFEIWKKTTIDSIEEVLSASTHPMSSPLRDVVFFDDLDSLKQHFFVVQRNEIQKSLSNPLIICEKNKNLKPIQMNSDFHKLFILYNESQSMVNMYDFFTQFKELDQQIKPLAQNPKRSKTDANDESVVRFLNTVSDFQYLGLIENAKRKCDHLVRLVWF